VRGRNDGAGTGTRLPIQSARRYSLVAKAALVSIISVAGFAAVYAVFFPVLESDIVDITDQPSLRTTVKDSLDSLESPSSSQTASDTVGPLDDASPSSTVTDVLDLSDSAQVTASAFYQVTTTSILAISDSVSSGAAAVDVMNLQETTGRGTAAVDVIAILDSATRILVLYVTDSLAINDAVSTVLEITEDDKDDGEDTGSGGGGGGPDRAVYDESYFDDRPLNRLAVTGVDIIDSQGRVMIKTIAGQSTEISMTVQNHQQVDQGYTVYVQITDKENVAIEIIQESGVIEDGGSIKVRIPWISAHPGSYTIWIVISDDDPDPTIISEPISKALIVG
jgi:hypothetical protein